ncbi:hypothetical protein EDD11_006628 [Mortierella claussenii]|nr:hypothetical protein EDD11_006628 [Mortierella claussenii]
MSNRAYANRPAGVSTSALASRNPTTGQNGVSKSRLGGASKPSSATHSTVTTPSISQQQDSWIKARQMHQQQLLTEHFGFSPLSFVDDVINSVNNMIYQASMALQDYVEAQMDELVAINAPSVRNLDVRDESAKCMHKFETLLESSVDKNFDRFELYALKNLFGVPEDVDIVLPHYEALDFEIAADREQQLDEQLEILRRKVVATKALNFKLRKELEIEEKRRRQLQTCKENIQFLKDAVDKHGDVAPVPQTLIFVRDNIETLHRRFQSLHEKLEQNARRLATGISTSTSTSAASTATVAAGGSTQYPIDSITLALHESLLGLEPDPRSIYIRSVVRRQVDEQLAADNDTLQPWIPGAGAAGSGQYHAPPTP